MKKTYLQPAVRTLHVATHAHLLTASSDYTVNSYRSGSRQTVGDVEE